MKNVQILKNVPPVYSEVLVHLKNIESPGPVSKLYPVVAATLYFRLAQQKNMQHM
jgi:hypothetical protein